MSFKLKKKKSAACTGDELQRAAEAFARAFRNQFADVIDQQETIRQAEQLARLAANKTVDPLIARQQILGAADALEKLGEVNKTRVDQAVAILVHMLDHLKLSRAAAEGMLSTPTALRALAAEVVKSI